MLYVPGVAAATANELGQLKGDEQTTKRRLEEEPVSPEMYERVLQKMEDEAQEVIEKDEEKLKKEAEKITELQHKINKEERKFVDMERELGKDEEIEAKLKAEKLKKAEEKLTKITEGHVKSPVKEKIGEVFHDVKDFAKDALENVADYAHLVFADEKELKAREKAVERADDVTEDNPYLTGEDYGGENDLKTDKKLNAAAQRIADLRKELVEKQNEMVKEDDELLRKEAQKIQHLQEKLEEEERKYNEIAADLADELNYDARIREEELKLKRLELTDDRNLDGPHHHHHHHNHH